MRPPARSTLLIVIVSLPFSRHFWMALIFFASTGISSVILGSFPSMETETPFVFLGFVAMIVPLLWAGRDAQL
ncbi:putative membrane protein [Burkholderia pseudomallei MSHR5609]|nr:putative membrane protein [Burkholderia pseudomallei MSHR5609]